MPTFISPGVGVMSEGVPAATETAIEPADRDSIVIVPRRPGPVFRPSEKGRPDDDLDGIIDEMFGQTTDEQPGRLDAVLVSGGLALAIWGWLSAASLIVMLVAGLLILLGAALPARSALRAYHRRRLARQRRREAAEGYPLDISDPSVAALVTAYEEVLAVAARSGSELAEPATVAAHLAVLEAAGVLEGRPPVGEADRGYVDARTTAIASVARQLSLAPRRSGHALERGRDATTAARAATVAVREDLESATDLGAMRRLEHIETRLGRENDKVPE